MKKTEQAYFVFYPIYEGPFKDEPRRVLRRDFTGLTQGQSVMMQPTYFEVFMSKVRRLEAKSGGAALIEAKALGFHAPIVGLAEV